MASKGFIETPKTTQQALGWLKEIIDKYHKDSLNVSQEEYDAGLRSLELLKQVITTKDLKIHRQEKIIDVYDMHTDDLTKSKLKELNKKIMEALLE